MEVKLKLYYDIHIILDNIMGTLQQAKYFQIVEYTFFLSLCGLSVFLMYGVLDKFIAGKTSISQSEKSLKER